MYTITVTSTAATNDEGTLPWAIAQANAYTGAESVQIVFELPQSQAEIHLDKDLQIIHDVSIVNSPNNIVLTGANIHTSAHLTLMNMVLPRLVLEDGGCLSGTGNRLTHEGSVLLIRSSNTSTEDFEADYPEHSYAQLCGTFNSNPFVWDGIKEYHFIGFSTQTEGFDYAAGYKLVFEDNAELVLDFPSTSPTDVNFFCELEADNQSIGNILSGEPFFPRIYFRSDRAVLHNASIMLDAFVGELCIYGHVEMDGGTILMPDSASYTSHIYLPGSLDISNATVDLEEIYAISHLHAENCLFYNYFEYWYKTDSLFRDNVFHSYFKLRSDIELHGSNNVFTNDQIAILSNFSGYFNLAELASEIQSEHAYVRVQGMLNGDMLLTTPEGSDNLVYLITQHDERNSVHHADWFDNDTSRNGIAEGGSLTLGNGTTLVFDKVLQPTTGIYAKLSGYSLNNKDSYYTIECGAGINLADNFTGFSTEEGEWETRADDFGLYWISPDGTQILRLNNGKGEFIDSANRLKTQITVEGNNLHFHVTESEDNNIWFYTLLPEIFHFEQNDGSVTFHDFHADGNITAVYDTYKAAFLSDTENSRLMVRNAVYLEEAGIELTGEENYISVEEGELSILRGKIITTSGTIVGGEAHLICEDSVFEGPLTSQGQCMLVKNNIRSDIRVCRGSGININQCRLVGTLTLESDVDITSLSGNDFSEARICLSKENDGRIIDLSGNYWGTTDLESIIAKIENYDEARVQLGKILAVDPTREFTYEGNSLKDNMLGKGMREICLCFTHEIDVATATTEHIYLLGRDDEEHTIESIRVEGKSVILSLSPFSKDGVFRLMIDEGLKDIAGNTFCSGSPYTYEDKIRVQLQSPRVVRITPEGDLAGIIQDFTLFFSSAMDVDSLRQHLRLTAPNQHEIAITGVEELGGNAYKIHFSPQQAFGQYTLCLSANAVSAAGNQMDQNNNGISGEAEDAYTTNFSLTDIDLRITRTELDSTGYVGESATIRWDGCNNTGTELIGEWTDGVYLSDDTAWDAHDILLGTVTHRGGLAAGESYSAELTTMIPPTQTGFHYLLVRTDIQGQEAGTKTTKEWVQNLAVIPYSVKNREVHDKETVTGKLSPNERYAYYVLPQSSAYTENLNINLYGEGVFYVYVKSGAPATPEDYDARYTVTPGSNSLSLSPDGQFNDIYLTFYSKSGTELPFSFTPQKADMALQHLEARSLNTKTESVFDLTGVNLPYYAEVQFIHRQSGTIYTPEEIAWVNNGHIKVTFPANSLVSGDYDVILKQGDEAVSLSNVVSMNSSGDSGFVITYQLPSQLGYHLISESTLSCYNIGSEAQAAPLVFFSISQNGAQKSFLTLDKSIVRNGFWTSTTPAGFTDSISFLASPDGTGYINPSGGSFSSVLKEYNSVFHPQFDASADISHTRDISSDIVQNILQISQDEAQLLNLVPDRTTATTTVYYTGWQQPWDFSYPEFDYQIGYITATDPTPIDWEAICGAPGIIGNEINTLIARSLSGTFGETWGAYVRMLNEELRQLSDNGVNTKDISADDLVDFTIRKAAGMHTPIQTLSSATDIAVQIPGGSLAVTRSYGADLYSHADESSFGHGWTHNWDISLSKNDEGNYILRISGAKVSFRPSYLGGYTCDAGEDYVLTQAKNGSLTINYKNGQSVYQFSADGKLLTTTDIHGNKVSFSYNADGKLSKLTHANGEWIAYEYNEQGYISRLTASNGDTSTFVYENGNLVRATNLLNDTVSYGYSDDFEHFLTSVTGTQGITSVIEYNTSGQISKTHSRLTAEPTITRGSVTMERSKDGGVTLTDAYGSASTYYYDNHGNLMKVTDVNGNALTYGYNQSGQILWSRNQVGSLTSYSYDADGELSATTNALGQTTRYNYDGNGFLIDLTDANGNTISYTRNSKGDVTAIRYTDGSEEHFGYDSIGNLISSTSRRGITTRFEYDAKGNLTDIIRPDGTDRFTYDAFGNMLSSTNANETTTFNYDERFRLISVCQADGHSVSYAYDANDRVTSMMDAAGNITRYSYNAWGDLMSVRDADGALIISYEYDREGRILSSTSGNGTSAAYEYTREGFAQSVTYYAPDGRLSDFYRYTYDETGARIGMESTSGSWTYTYDAIEQMIAADFAPATGSDIAELHLQYEYDAVGNRTRTIINGEETIYATNELNQTTAAGNTHYTYDADGNLIFKQDAEGMTAYSWDSQGHLIQMTLPNGDVYEYTYNTFGERVSSCCNGQVSTYVYDGTGRGNLLTAYTPDEHVVSNVYANTLIGSRDQALGMLWNETDALGSITAVSDSSGNLIATYSYEPFGNIISETAGISTPYGWLGTWGISDEAAGLALMRARYYDKTTGTFISPDPIGVNGGLNLYAYCGNSPVRYIDRQGTAPWYQTAWDIGTSLIGGFEPIHGSFAGAVGDFAVLSAYGSELDGGTKLATIFDLIGNTTVLGLEYKAVTTGVEASTWPVAAVAMFAHDATLAISAMSKGEQLNYEDLSLMGLGAGMIADGITTWIMEGGRDRAKEREIMQNTLNRLREDIVKQKKVSTPSAGSHDPNDLIGIAGYGEQNYITGKEAMPFMLEFENEEDATAPARWIRVFTSLDEAYDLESFTLDSVYLAGHLFSMKDEQDSFNQLTTLSFNGQEVLTQIEVNLNRDTRELSAVFTAIDPETGMMLQDMEKGLLYPNNDMGVGVGYITYTLKLKEGLPTGTTINNVADIYFDFNDVIPTPEITYTIDADAAHASMLAAEVQADNSIMLTWEGADAEGGSGFAGVGIYVSKDGGELTFWQAVSAQSDSVNYIAEAGHRYGFAVVGIDHAGNIEPVKQEAEIFVNLTNGDVVDSSKTIPLTAADALAGGTVTNSESVIDSVGYGDTTDFYTFTAVADGTYAVALDMLAWEGISLSVGTADEFDIFHPQKERLLFMGDAHNAIEGITLRKGETAYIRVGAMEGAVSTDYYELRVVGEVPAAASLTDNNSPANAAELVSSSKPAAVQGWVGAGDACDFYRLQLAEASNLQLTLSDVETAARVKVYAEQADGSRALLSAGTATAAAGLDRTLALTSGSYFIEVASLNPDNGLSNSAYTLELKEQKGKQSSHYMLAAR